MKDVQAVEVRVLLGDGSAADVSRPVASGPSATAVSDQTGAASAAGAVGALDAGAAPPESPGAVSGTAVSAPSGTAETGEAHRPRRPDQQVRRAQRPPAQPARLATRVATRAIRVGAPGTLVRHPSPRLTTSRTETSEMWFGVQFRRPGCRQCHSDVVHTQLARGVESNLAGHAHVADA